MKTIPIKNSSQMALVDDGDFDLLAASVWYAKSSGSGKTSYPVRLVRDGPGSKIRGIKMHVDLFGKYADHKNGNGLDNQRHNLRACTKSQNQANRPPSSGRRFKGVFRTCSGFFARVAGEYLGHFRTEIAAAKAYNEAAEKKFGAFACLNTFTARELEATP